MKIKILSLVFLSVMCLSCKTTQKDDSEKKQTQTSKDFAQKITNKYWKLIKLDGEKVQMAKNQEKERYFKLNSHKNRIQGFSGCNTFSGEFRLEKEKKHIHFSKMASTMKACPDVEIDESTFLEVFKQTDNYTLHQDTLTLNIGRRAPLAVFKAVYF